MSDTHLLLDPTEDSRLTIEQAIQAIGETAEQLYEIREELPKNSPEYKFAKELWHSWQRYLSSP